MEMNLIHLAGSLKEVYTGGSKFPDRELWICGKDGEGMKSVLLSHQPSLGIVHGELQFLDLTFLSLCRSQ